MIAWNDKCIAFIAASFFSLFPSHPLRSDDINDSYSGLFTYHISTNTWNLLYLDVNHQLAANPEIHSVKARTLHAMLFDDVRRFMSKRKSFSRDGIFFENFIFSFKFSKLLQFIYFLKIEQEEDLCIWRTAAERLMRLSHAVWHRKLTNNRNNCCIDFNAVWFSRKLQLRKTISRTMSCSRRCE